jgi:hypothetical protein
VAGKVVSFIGHARLVDEFQIEFGHLREIAGDVVANFLGMTVVLQV